MNNSEDPPKTTTTEAAKEEPAAASAPSIEVKEAQPSKPAPTESTTTTTTTSAAAAAPAPMTTTKDPLDVDNMALSAVAEGAASSSKQERPTVGNDAQAEPSPKRIKTGEEKEDSNPKTDADDTNKTNEANDDDEAPADGEIVDVCTRIGLKGGERLEVEWQLEELPTAGEEGTDDDAAAAAGEAKMVNKWWGCKLVPHDGRTEDGVAIRVLDYDPYPEGGFLERSLEEVIFLSHDICFSPDSQAEFKFRPEGVVQFNNEEEAREAINGILMTTLNKHNGSWKNLDRAQQARIADGIAQKKEQLVEAIMTHSRSSVIGGDDMKEILQGIMQRR